MKQKLYFPRVLVAILFVTFGSVISLPVAHAQDYPKKPLGPLPPKEEGIEEPVKTHATPPFWEKCLKHHPKFSQLPAVDKELGLLFTLPERVLQMSKELLAQLTGRPLDIPMTLEERELQRRIQKGDMLIRNCRTWTWLEEISATVLQITGLLEREGQSWQTYLEEQQIRNKVKLFSDPQQVTQHLKMLRQKTEQFDLTRYYIQQMSEEERQFLDNFNRELTLVREFLDWIKKQKK
ncbi:MAG: hypothetical protein QME90_01615 [Thermodesulfobacteriota bacterium]|nr:hypothetical protein [Thermodesulfobacteriota bacterium]